MPSFWPGGKAMRKDILDGDADTQIEALWQYLPDGKMIPVCSGIRSPCGIGPNEHGVMFYAESQGPWNGSCSLRGEKLVHVNAYYTLNEIPGS